jgi:hypothetical protein
MSPDERAAVIAELERSRDAFLAAMAAIPADAWSRQPAPGQWSAGECAEHVIKIERSMRKFLPGMIATAQADPARRGALAGRDAALAEALRDRGTRRTAPENVRPEGGRYASAEQAAADFAPARETVIDFARTTDADLRGLFAPHPALGEADAYQWLLFIAHHTDRHASQLEELGAELARGAPRATA